MPPKHFLSCNGRGRLLDYQDIIAGNKRLQKGHDTEGGKICPLMKAVYIYYVQPFCTFAILASDGEQPFYLFVILARIGEKNLWLVPPHIMGTQFQTP